jgi:hypothetical protein
VDPCGRQPERGEHRGGVAMAESSGNPGASHRNSDGSIDRGLWQINSVHGSLSTFNRLANARAAVSISSNGRNWNPWTTYKSGAYRAFLSDAGGGGAGSSSRGGRHAKAPTIRPTSGVGHRTGPNTSVGSGSIGASGLGTGTHSGPGAGLFGPGESVGYAQGLDDVGLEKATATAHDNLAGIIRALQHERRLKTRRLKKVNRTLRRRITKATRKALVEEKTQLVTDLAEIAGLLKEYRADARGGARTISAADDLTAGVAPEGSHLGPGGTAVVPDAEAGPTPMDFANAAVAEASLTPDLNDDVSAAAGVLGIATGDLAAARASGDPRKISEAISAWTAANDAWKAATEAVTAGTETQQRLTEAIIALTAETKTQNDFAASVAGIASTQAVRALADVISGEIYGPTNNRRQTAGTGALVRMP